MRRQPRLSFLWPWQRWPASVILWPRCLDCPLAGALPPWPGVAIAFSACIEGASQVTSVTYPSLSATLCMVTCARPLRLLWTERPIALGRRRSEAGAEGEGLHAQLEEAELAAAVASRRAQAAEVQLEALQQRLTAAEKRAEELSWQVGALCLFSSS